MLGYFYTVHIQASEKEETNFFITLKETLKDGKPTELTAENIMSDVAYKTFAEGKSLKRVFADYTIYQTENDYTQIAPIYQGEHFQKLIDEKSAIVVSRGEVELIQGKKQSVTKPKSKKKKGGKKQYIIIASVAVICLLIGLGAGLFMNGSNDKTSSIVATNSDLEADGLIMPEVVEFAPNAELITISIDRSYSPVPREDIQIKGEIIGSVAVITLPTFDRSEFFAHVPGYTWGFTSDPNGTKIEYYGGTAYNFTHDVKFYRVLVKYGGGNGTKDDPYLINYYDQLELMASEKARGYFRQTADLEFPMWASHTSINTVNELKSIPQSEYFEYDGGGYRIAGLNAPLFGTVSGSVIKNVNIINSNIDTPSYNNLGFIVNQAYNYRYEVDGKTYETGETIIHNSTVSHSSITVQIPEFDTDGNPTVQTVNAVAEPSPVIPPDMELTDEQVSELYNIPLTKQGEYAIGAVSGLGGQIENCYVTNVTISAQLDSYFLYVGGISGKPANVINSGVNGVTIVGNIFHAGGIVGSAGGSRFYKADGSELPIFYGGNIQGCFAKKLNIFSETSAGGIAGEGSTNADDSLISNCYTTGLDLVAGIFENNDPTKPIKLGRAGGIIGVDGNDNNGHLIVNSVSDSLYLVIGSSRNSSYNDTVRLAPDYAFYQVGILDVLNRNTVAPNNPAEIFTGKFVFAEESTYPFPQQIEELFAKTEITEVE